MTRCFVQVNRKVTLNDHPGEPTDLAVLPDSRVPHVTRPGEVKPVAGQPFTFGDTVQFEVRVIDDQPVDCAKFSVTYVLGTTSTDTSRPPPTAAPARSGPSRRPVTTRRTTT
ncbi:hypothetical protein [Micromonospora psammae]|uniref:hypothetical protein n=1 Tax=Micromonospora sp. CPCC 205556 TaxID=3122398 RepID=UPI002FF3AA1D